MGMNLETKDALNLIESKIGFWGLLGSVLCTGLTFILADHIAWLGFLSLSTKQDVSFYFYLVVVFCIWILILRGAHSASKKLLSVLFKNRECRSMRNQIKMLPTPEKVI